MIGIFSRFKPSNYRPKDSDLDSHFKAIDIALKKTIGNKITSAVAPTGGTTIDAEARTAIDTIISNQTAILTILKNNNLMKAS